MNFHLLSSFIVILLILPLIVLGQKQFIKAVKAGGNPNTAPQTVSSDVADDSARKNIASRFQGASNICIFGIWAFYNTPNYGEGLERRTTVLVKTGPGPITCTQNNQQMIGAQSVQFLGNPDASMDGLDIFTDANFLGAKMSWTTISTTIDSSKFSSISAIRLGSLAITGSKKWRLCADANCLILAVCIDGTKYNGMYFNKDTQGDKSIPWPLFIRAVVEAKEGECDNDFRPN